MLDSAKIHDCPHISVSSLRSLAEMCYLWLLAALRLLHSAQFSRPRLQAYRLPMSLYESVRSIWKSRPADS